MDYGSKMVSKIRIFTNHVIIIVPIFLGNQGWPSVAYNERSDEYMIAFQFRAGTWRYFSNKYIIISQRVQSARTERAAGPSLLVKANGQGGPTDWVHAMGPLIKYNPVTGKNQAPVVQKVDCAIHWIAQLVYRILVHWIVTYPVDSAIQLLNTDCGLHDVKIGSI